MHEWALLIFTVAVPSSIGGMLFLWFAQNILKKDSEIDLFKNLIKAIADIANSDPQGKFASSHNVIADHLRSMSFLIADGVLPSNEGRGFPSPL